MPPIKKYLNIVALTSLGFTGNAVAAPIVFNLTTPDTRLGVLTSEYAQQYDYHSTTHNGVGLSVTGWSYGKVTQCDSYQTIAGVNHCTASSTSINYGSKAHQDFVGQFGVQGLGVEVAKSPNHAMNNRNGDFDMLLFSFTEAVTLDSIDLGWIRNSGTTRSDVSILAGTSAALLSPLNSSWQSLLGNGWQLAGQYDNVGLNEYVVNASDIASKYWLIGAYNPLLGNAIPNNDIDTEAFKLAAVTVSTSQVPEPSLLGLFGLGLLGFAVMRRRKI